MYVYMCEHTCVYIHVYVCVIHVCVIYMCAVIFLYKPIPLEFLFVYLFIVLFIYCLLFIAYCLFIYCIVYLLNPSISRQGY